MLYPIVVFHLPHYFIVPFNIPEQNKTYTKLVPSTVLYIIKSNIFLRPEEAVLKMCQKLIFGQLFLLIENL